MWELDTAARVWHIWASFLWEVEASGRSSLIKDKKLLRVCFYSEHLGRLALVS